MNKKICVLILIVFVHCIGVKNNKSSNNVGLFALLTGGLSSVTNSKELHNGSQTAGTGNGTSNFSSNEIKAETGGVFSLGKEVSLTIPAEAVEENVTISVSKVAVTSEDTSILPIQSGYKFGPADLNFSEPATLKVCYNPEFLKSKNLSEKQIQLYYLDPDTKVLASIGGTVDLVAHCVSANVEHFSTYIPAVSTSTVTTASYPTFLPAKPISGMPLKLRTSIVPANGASVQTAILNYRVKGQTVFNQVPLIQDTTVTTNKSFYYIIPASDVTPSGIEYYLEVKDSLDKLKRIPSRNFLTKTVTKTLNAGTPLRYSNRKTSITMADGTYRNLSVQVLDNDGLWQTAFSERNEVQGSMGSVSQIRNTIRFTAENLGSGILTSYYGGNQISLAINVVVGKLASVKILDGAGAVITNALQIIQSETYPLRIQGYDMTGNTKIIKPAITVSGGIGAYSSATGVFSASPTPNTSGKLTAAVGTITGSIDINVVPNSYTVSGIATGIPFGKSITLQNNGGDDLTVSQDGSFSFATSVFSGGSYSVTISTQTGGINCILSNQSGSVQMSNINNVTLTCEKTIEMVGVWNLSSVMPNVRNSQVVRLVNVKGKLYLISGFYKMMSNACFNNILIQEADNPAAATVYPLNQDYDKCIDVDLFTVIDDRLYFADATDRKILSFDGENIAVFFDLNSALDENAKSSNYVDIGVSSNSLIKIGDRFYLGFTYHYYYGSLSQTCNRVMEIKDGQSSSLTFQENFSPRNDAVVIDVGNVNDELHIIADYPSAGNNAFGYAVLRKLNSSGLLEEVNIPANAFIPVNFTNLAQYSFTNINKSLYFLTMTSIPVRDIWGNILSGSWEYAVWSYDGITWSKSNNLSVRPELAGYYPIFRNKAAPIFSYNNEIHLLFGDNQGQQYVYDSDLGSYFYKYTFSLLDLSLNKKMTFSAVDSSGQRYLLNQIYNNQFYFAEYANGKYKISRY